jgi:23S rRNA (cytosine1962-C5)-methyltransferase
MIEVPKNWQNFELIDFGDGEKLERWGEYIVRRPDQNALVTKTLPNNIWSSNDLEFQRISKEEGKWLFKNHAINEHWLIQYQTEDNKSSFSLNFKIKPTKYKHLGLFPEQSVNWEWIAKTIQNALRNDPVRQVRVLNLFAYTGGSSLAASLAGAMEVVHVDSSKSVNNLAKENQKVSNLQENNIRFITEDVRKFVAKEIKRGKIYDAIIMDPPLYGRGPKGELWKINTDLISLINDCVKLLSPDPLFFIVNLYAGNNLEKKVLESLVKLATPPFNMQVKTQALGIQADKLQKILPCGIVIRYYKK